MKRKKHIFTNIEFDVKSIMTLAASLGFRRIDSADRINGSIHDKLETPSNYEFISFKRVFNNTPLFNAIEKLGSKIGLKDQILSSSLLKFQPGDILQWSEVDIWNENTIGKFFSIALTDNKIEFKDKIEIVPKYSAIEFNTGDIHRITNVNSNQYWLVLIVPDYLTIN
jgi:hypothetical protein